MLAAATTPAAVWPATQIVPSSPVATARTGEIGGWLASARRTPHGGSSTNSRPSYSATSPVATASTGAPTPIPWTVTLLPSSPSTYSVSPSTYSVSRRSSMTVSRSVPVSSSRADSPPRSFTAGIGRGHRRHPPPLASRAMSRYSHSPPEGPLSHTPSSAY